MHFRIKARKGHQDKITTLPASYAEKCGTANKRGRCVVL
jgi:hypothetical protein